MNNLPNRLVRARTVNGDGTVTLSAQQWVIVAEAATPEGEPLWYGIRVVLPTTSHPEYGYMALTTVELLPDGWQAC